MADDTNPAQRRRWNDPRWTTSWPKREPVTDAVTAHLFEIAALRPGQRVLDIGSGGGKTSIEASRRVGAAGTVVGADISGALAALARERAAEADADVTFEVVDMQHERVNGGPFDVALSQFGVMFFDEPVTAFANIARHLREDGRLVFVCWQAAERNPWWPSHAISDLLAPPPPPAKGKSPAGPFALADTERTTEILHDSGFVEVACTAFDVSVDVPKEELDDDQLASMGVPEGEIPAAMHAIEDYLLQFRIGPEVWRYPLSYQIFEARRAGYATSAQTA